MSKSGHGRWFEWDRKRSYTKLYGHLSVLIKWDGGQLQIPYVELMLCSKKRLQEILRLAAKCGGWKLINHETGEQL